MMVLVVVGLPLSIKVKGKFKPLGPLYNIRREGKEGQRKEGL